MFSEGIRMTTLHWTPEGKREHRRPKNTSGRTVEADMKAIRYTWSAI